MTKNSEKPLPFDGLKVIDLGHTVMGPTAGMILADMGAEVVRVERTPKGDRTRYLKGFGCGFYTFFNRNKKSLCLDLKDEDGLAIFKRMVAWADVLIENFAPDTMARLGLDYPALSQINPGLVYCSLKGFMPGPYADRLALDEVVQMMGGLAYMTGPRGMPLRAGASVTDITGGMFGVIGILAALRERDRTGRGQKVTSTLFESVAFLMGSHMAYRAVTGEPAPPMPERAGTWAIYELFKSKDDKQVFIGITSDQQWLRFCEVFGFDDLAKDDRLATNNQRVDERPRLLPELALRFKKFTEAEIISQAEKASIPFAPVATPDDLFEDPQLKSNGLLETVLNNGVKSKFPRLPLLVGDHDFNLRANPPQVGEGGDEVLQELGLDRDEIDALKKRGVVVGP